MKIGSKLAIVVFAAVAALHLLRIVFAIPLSVGTWTAPMWANVLGVLVPGLIAVQLWKESQ